MMNSFREPPPQPPSYPPSSAMQPSLSSGGSGGGSLSPRQRPLSASALPAPLEMNGANSNDGLPVSPTAASREPVRTTQVESPPEPRRESLDEEQFSYHDEFEERHSPSRSPERLRSQVSAGSRSTASCSSSVSDDRKAQPRPRPGEYDGDYREPVPRQLFRGAPPASPVPMACSGGMAGMAHLTASSALRETDLMSPLHTLAASSSSLAASSSSLRGLPMVSPARGSFSNGGSYAMSFGTLCYSDEEEIQELTETPSSPSDRVSSQSYDYNGGVVSSSIQAEKAEEHLDRKPSASSAAETKMPAKVANLTLEGAVESNYDQHLSGKPTASVSTRSPYVDELEGELQEKFRREEQEAKRQQQMQEDDEAFARRLQEQLNQEPVSAASSKYYVSDEELATQVASMFVKEDSQYPEKELLRSRSEDSVDEQRRILEQIRQDREKKHMEETIALSSSDIKANSRRDSRDRGPMVPAGLSAYEDDVYYRNGGGQTPTSPQDSVNPQLQSAFERQFRSREDTYTARRGGHIPATQDELPQHKHYGSEYRSVSSQHHPLSAGRQTDWQTSQQRALLEYQQMREGRRNQHFPMLTSGYQGSAATSGAFQYPDRVPPSRNLSSVSSNSFDSVGSIGGATSSAGNSRGGNHEMLVRRGVHETERAVQSGRAHVVVCQGCRARLQAPIHYSLVYCPSCGVVSPGSAGRPNQAQETAIY